MQENYVSYYKLLYESVQSRNILGDTSGRII